MELGTVARRVLQNPHYLPREMNRLFHSRLGARDHDPRGVDILAANWDSLVLLDACRHDIFAEHVNLPGETDWAYSRAGTTTEFLRANFGDKRIYDTIYITTNTWIFMLDDVNAEFFLTLHAEDDETAVEMAAEKYEQHEDKRFIVHLTAPHHPYTGPTAAKHFPETQSDELFDRIKRSELNISDETLRNAYLETLENVVPLVRRLLDFFKGRTVVSADHGELLGDRTGPIPMRDYGHYSRYYVDPLVKVPWHTYDSGERREITEDEPIGMMAPRQEEIEDRLAQLGYL